MDAGGSHLEERHSVEDDSIASGELLEEEDEYEDTEWLVGAGVTECLQSVHHGRILRTFTLKLN